MLRSIPIRQAGVRVTTFMGGDRDLVMFSGLIAAAIVMPAFNIWYAWVGGLLIWIPALFLARLMGKKDPLMRFVYMRHRRYAAFYPARSTPFRDNKNSQARGYGLPHKTKK
jgi:type IV secretory pathway TrbD component